MRPPAAASAITGGEALNNHAAGPVANAANATERGVWRMTVNRSAAHNATTTGTTSGDKNNISPLSTLMPMPPLKPI